MNVRPFPILCILLILAASAHAGSVTTQGGNITSVSALIPQNAIWHGICGTTSNVSSSNSPITASAGTIQCIDVATGSANCTYGPRFINIIFSNSSANISSLSAGNLTILDTFVANSVQSGTATFAATSTFVTSSFGNITSVPTTYTEPSANSTFRLGYLQDQNGSLAFITNATLSRQVGFNGSLVNFQAILPTRNASNVTYYISIDLACATTGTASSPPQNFTVGSATLLFERNATFDAVANTSTVLLRVTNIGSAASGSIVLRETIPNSAATSTSQLSFSIQPTRFESGSIIAVWELPSGLSAGQSFSVNYTMQAVVSSLSEFTFNVTALSTAAPSPAPARGSTVSPGIGPSTSIPPVSAPIAPPSLDNIVVYSFSPFQQVAPGNSLVINQLLENPTSRPIKFNISLAGAWDYSSQQQANVVLSPGEKRNVPIPVSIPTDASQGYYSFSVHLSSTAGEVNYPSVMQIIPPYRIGQPTVERQFLLDYENRQTVVMLTITNKNTEAIPFLQVFEHPPSDVLNSVSSQGKQISLSFAEGSSGELDGSSIKWSLQNVRPSEQRTVSYKIPLLLTDISTYSSWQSTQIEQVSSESVQGVSLTNIQVAQMLPGEAGKISMDVVNNEPVQQSAVLSMLPPAGWRVEKRVFELSLPPKSSTPISFKLTSPEDAPSGIHGLQLRLSYADKFYDKNLFVYLGSPEVSMFSPPIAAQVSGWVGPNLQLLAIAAIALLVLFFGGKALLARLRAPRFNAERLGDLKKMQEMLEGKQ
ncbi:MAG: hypothetical protein QW568_02560 [Candidatus Anstonellaceae archaeon]